MFPQTAANECLRRIPEAKDWIVRRNAGKRLIMGLLNRHLKSVPLQSVFTVESVQRANF